MSQLFLDSHSLLDRFDISVDDLSLLKKCGETLGAATIDRVVERFYEWLPQQPEFNVFFSSQDTVERVKKLQKGYWAGFFSGVVDQPYVDYRIRIGEIHAQRDLPSLIYFASVLRFQLLFLEELQTSGLGKDRLLPGFSEADASTRAFSPLVATFVL